MIDSRELYRLTKNKLDKTLFFETTFAFSEYSYKLLINDIVWFYK